MHNAKAVILGAAVSWACAVCSGQSIPTAARTPTVAPPATTVPATQPVPPPGPASSPAGPSKILAPSLDNVQQTLSSIKTEKWKRGTVRDEAGTNIAAILRDLQKNLPPLIAAADTQPETLTNVLPMSRNVAALYDVLLRVDEASRVSAPSDQVAQLEQALENLRKSRLVLDDHLQDLAAALEKQVGDLKETVKTQAANKCPVLPASTPPVLTPPPVHKAKKKAKPPAPKPAASATPGSPTTAPSAPKP